MNVVRKVIGVISDTHGLLRKEVIKQLEDCDLIIHAGDIGKLDVISQLENIAPVKAVRGNVDREEWCLKFPLTEAIEIADTFIYVIHNIDELDLDPGAAEFNIVICGHSHKSLVKEIDGVTYLNPGSVGPKRFNLPISLGKIEIGSEINIRIINIPE